MRRSAGLSMLFVLLSVARLAEGQFLPAMVRPVSGYGESEPVDTVAYAGDTGGAVLGALVFGAIAFVGGWYTSDLETLLWAESIAIGLGAHVGNGGRGNGLAPLLASVGVMLAARVAANHVDLGSDDFTLLVPILQIGAAVAAETATSPRRAAR